MRVLIVGDNADIAETTSTLLCLMGHDCRTAERAVDALTVAETFEPEIAFLDLGLPDLTGYDLLGQLRALLGARAPYAVAVTGWHHARSKARDAGFDEFFLKPATKAQLCAVIERAQQRQRDL